MRDLLKIFKAMADETRMRILYLLMEVEEGKEGKEREACVLEIKQAMKISQTRASRNLGILRDAGLLKDRREGPLVFYSLDAKLIKKQCNGLDAMVKQAFVTDQTALRHRERLKKPLSRLTDKD